MNPHQAPSAPLNVLLGSTSTSMLTVSFDPPASNGGDTITAYEIMWDKTSTFNSLFLPPHKGKVKVAATERAYTIELLSLQTQYYVQVSAVNGAGPGTAQKATPRNQKPELQKPGKPVSLTAVQTSSAAQILVSWQRPRVPFHGLPCFGTAANPTNCPSHAGGG